MISARKLLVKYMDLIKDPERATSLFAANAAIETPYLVDVGLPATFRGHDGILAFLRQINTLFPDAAFTSLQVFVDTPDQVVSEYEIHCSAPATKRHYHQLFFGRLMASGGQITLL